MAKLEDLLIGDAAKRQIEKIALLERHVCILRHESFEARIGAQQLWMNCRIE